MSVVNIAVCRLPHGADLALPAHATPGSAGLDLRAAVAGDVEILPGRWALIPTGIALALPPGTEGQVRPRSGLALRHGITVLNAPGTIDSDYRGEIAVPLINHGAEPFTVRRGDRIAQLIVAPVLSVALSEAETLPEPPGARRVGGFGSTGR